MYKQSDMQNTEFLMIRGWRMWLGNELIRGKYLLLCPESEFKNIPNGTQLWDISGYYHVVGTDPINMDTRGGLLAYGILFAEITVPDPSKTTKSTSKYRSIDDE